MKYAPKIPKGMATSRVSAAWKSKLTPSERYKHDDSDPNCGCTLCVHWNVGMPVLRTLYITRKVLV